MYSDGNIRDLARLSFPLAAVQWAMGGSSTVKVGLFGQFKLLRSLRVKRAAQPLEACRVLNCIILVLGAKGTIND